MSDQMDVVVEDKNGLPHRRVSRQMATRTGLATVVVLLVLILPVLMPIALALIGLFALGTAVAVIGLRDRPDDS